MLFYVRRFIGKIGKIGKKTRKTALSSVFFYRQNERAIGKITADLVKKRGFLGGIA